MRDRCPVEHAQRVQFESYLDAEENALCSTQGYGNVPETIGPISRLIRRIRLKIQSFNVVDDGANWGRIK